jgi:Flp pilus assembly protein TadG
MRAIKTPLQRFVKRLARSKSGNALLMVGLGLPVFIGAAGYATDMAQAYAWKRELQHSVDQAAIAGAWALVYDKNTQTYTTRAQQEFDANLAVTKTFADADATVQLGNYGSTTNNSVIVSARATKMLPFSGFLVHKAMTVFARAQATYASGGSYKACLMALKKGEGQTFTVEGSATVQAACGLGALSCEDDAIKIDVQDDPGKSGVTTDSIVTCGTASVPDYLKAKVTDNASGISNPFEGLPAPTPPDEAAKTLGCPANGKTSRNITPGRYTEFNVTCPVVMAKGIYVIDGGVLDLTSNKGDITGTGVMFVLRHGAQLLMGGSGNGGKVNLSPMEAADFVGTANEAYKDKYAGMLVYEDSTDVDSPVDHKFNGNADVKVRGTIYLPNGNLTVNGNSNTEPLCFQLWSLKLKISGNTTISTTCTSTQTNSAGSATSGVRLVA